MSMRGLAAMVLPRMMRIRLREPKSKRRGMGGVIKEERASCRMISSLFKRSLVKF